MMVFWEWIVSVLRQFWVFFTTAVFSYLDCTVVLLSGSNKKYVIILPERMFKKS
jgi:hypothetical protein